MLIGRDEEMLMLEAALRSGERGVMVAGAAGVGKTSLVLGFVGRSEARAHPVVRVFASSASAAIPLGAFAPVLSGSYDGGANRAAGLRGAAAEIAGMGSGERVVLFVDDAHSLDEISAALLHQLVLDPRVFLLTTVRTGERPPDPITALWKDGHVARIELQPLSGGDLAALIRSIVGGPVDASTERRLADLSAGNALYLRELINVGLQEGVLAPRSGLWIWSGPLVLGARLNELIESRMSLLAAPEREVLEYVAVGEPIRLGALVALTDPASIERVERLGLIRVMGSDPLVRFAHPLHGEVMRAGMGTFRAKVVSGRLAEAAAQEGDGSVDVLRRALWMIDGDIPQDPELLNLAARAAISAWDNELAERFGRAAARAGSFQGLSDVAESLYWQGRYSEAVAVAKQCDTDDVDSVVRVQSRITQASSAMWGEGDAAKAERILADLAADTAFPEDWRFVGLAQQGSVRMMSGRPWEGVELVEHLLTHEQSRLRAGALQTCSTAWALGGQAERAVQETGWVLVDEELLEQSPQLVGGVLVGHTLALWLAGQVAHLEALTSVVYAMSAGRDTDGFRGVFAFLRGRASLAAGRIGAAIEQLVEANAVLAEQDPGNVRSWALGSLAQAYGQAGEAAAALAASEESFAVALPSIRVWESELITGQAWALAAAGQHSVARAALRTAYDRSVHQGQWGAAVVHLHEIARLGGAVEVADEIVEVVSRVDGALLPAFAAHAEGLVADDVDRLVDAAERLEGCGSLLLAAEAYAHAASAARAAGLTVKRASAVAAARRLLAECVGASTPALQSLDDSADSASLSRREREVAHLAALGKPSAEIAEALFVSVRTVDNHLARVYAKLGIAGRAELSSALLTT